MISAKSAEGDGMAPHWWVPVKASDAKARKNEVRTKLPQSASLHSFWKTPDGTQLYAVIKSNELTDADLDGIGANGDPIQLEDVD
jgi:hypothetical protein